MSLFKYIFGGPGCLSRSCVPMKHHPLTKCRTSCWLIDGPLDMSTKCGLMCTLAMSTYYVFYSNGNWRKMYSTTDVPCVCFLRVAARDKSMLYNMGITHIVNAASGPPHVNTGPRFYRDMNIHFYGVEADDSSDFIISVFFYPTARFIRAALSKNGELNWRKYPHVHS